jgi:signal transduction histidine kinase
MKVLIADDEPVSLRLLQSYLQKWGYEVTVARNGMEAWKLFQEDDFRIVISDWMMPEMDGLELIGRICAAQRSGYVYTILVTARSQKEDLVEGMDAGADDFVTKPFDRDELRVRLREGERIISLEQTLADQNRALREAQVALVQSEKLAGLGQLAAGMAHEINNPISYVTNNLAVLHRDVRAAMNVLDQYRSGHESLARVEPELATEVLRLEQECDLAYLRENLNRLFEMSIDGLQRVRDIVRNLRDFARLDEGEFKELDLNEAVKATLEILHYDIEQKQVQLKSDYQPLPPVSCHPQKINQVFLNLALNAIQACSAGGLIEVRTKSDPAGEVVVEIEDHGCGIKAADLPRIFEPFFTTRAVGQGKGLGLAVSYGIVRDHGGSIEVETEVGRGSTFRVRLPRHGSPSR